MKKTKLPRTDSIQELAEFWDAHDLTDFSDELVEVTEPVFERATPIAVRFEASDAKALKQIADAEHVTVEELIRRWVRQQLPRRNGRKAVDSAKTRRGRGAKRPENQTDKKG